VPGSEPSIAARIAQAYGNMTAIARNQGSMALRAYRGLTLTRMFASKYAVLDNFRTDPTGSGATYSMVFSKDAMLLARARAKGLTNALTPGFSPASDGDVAPAVYADHEARLLYTIKLAKNSGIPSWLVDDYFYAASAAQRNGIAKGRHPYDAMGRETGGDLSAFVYYTGPDGRLATVDEAVDSGNKLTGNKERLRPGFQEVRGPDAPSKYMATLRQQYAGSPEALQALDAGIQQLKQANRHIIATQEVALLGPGQCLGLGIAIQNGRRRGRNLRGSEQPVVHVGGHALRRLGMAGPVKAKLAKVLVSAAAADHDIVASFGVEVVVARSADQHVMADDPAVHAALHRKTLNKVAVVAQG
jgi:hypothetical protein